MNNVTGTSETLIGSLCKEADLIRTRIRHIMNLTGQCSNIELLSRLNQEKNNLESRRVEIITIADSLTKKNLSDKLSTKFLLEICNRKIK